MKISSQLVPISPMGCIIQLETLVVHRKICVIGIAYIYSKQVNEGAEVQTSDSGFGI